MISGKTTRGRCRAFTLPLVATALCLPQPNYAARPVITDDARIVEPKACQLETWVRRNEGSTEYWALPACNFTGKLELSLGGALTREAGETYASEVQLQAKTILKELEKNSWGIGVVLGYLRHVREQPRGDIGRSLYGYVPLSASFADDRFVLHTNFGLQRPQDESRHRFTWGVGAEVRLHPRLYFIPEVFKQEQGRPQFQMGLR